MPKSRIRRYIRHGMLPQLAVFEAISRLGSYTRAAEELHLAQPTVSGLVRKLADSAGAPLFRKVGRRVVPTEAGRRLYATADEVLNTLERASAEMEALRAERRGGAEYEALRADRSLAGAE